MVLDVTFVVVVNYQRNRFTKLALLHSETKEQDRTYICQGRVRGASPLCSEIHKFLLFGKAIEVDVDK